VAGFGFPGFCSVLHKLWHESGTLVTVYLPAVRVEQDNSDHMVKCRKEKAQMKRKAKNKAKREAFRAGFWDVMSLGPSDVVYGLPRPKSADEIIRSAWRNTGTHLKKAMVRHEQQKAPQEK
jgi:hypothetical protein